MKGSLRPYDERREWSQVSYTECVEALKAPLHVLHGRGFGLILKAADSGDLDSLAELVETLVGGTVLQGPIARMVL